MAECILARSRYNLYNFFGRLRRFIGWIEGGEGVVNLHVPSGGGCVVRASIMEIASVGMTFGE